MTVGPTATPHLIFRCVTSRSLYARIDTEVPFALYTRSVQLFLFSFARWCGYSEKKSILWLKFVLILQVRFCDPQKAHLWTETVLAVY